MRLSLNFFGSKWSKEPAREIAPELYESESLNEVRQLIKERRSATRKLSLSYGILFLTIGVCFTAYFSFISFNKPVQLACLFISVFLFFPTVYPYIVWVGEYKKLRTSFMMLERCVFLLRSNPQFIQSYKNRNEQLSILNYKQCFEDICYVTIHLAYFILCIATCAYFAHMRYKESPISDGYEIYIVYASFFMLPTLWAFRLSFINVLSLRRIQQSFRCSSLESSNGLVSV
ncbi:hypothetical protein CAEBREN_09856 [Caenorhabditis brenneri]|uniref:Uncharacterized protein n=1 Tax=Caenorhabditis brenneri TaxID=135651 RepID=G0MGD5_CAEBE|nr:hypothetical protein CAEBREN_09856 [Caenorhabditis brenneri]